jgi:hypothetical protein
VADPTPVWRLDAAPSGSITDRNQDVLRAYIAARAREGYHVVSETPTSAQLIKPKRFNSAVFLAMPVYVIEYLGMRDKQIYVTVDAAGQISATGSGVELSLNERAQRQPLPVRLGIIVVVVTAIFAVLYAISIVTGT